MTRELVLGIDFGSASPIAGVLVNNRIELVQDAGDSVIPSVIYVPDRGDSVVGRRAIAHQIAEPSNTIRSVKRLLGLESSNELVRRFAASTALPLDVTTPRPMFKLRSGAQAPEQVAASIIGYVRTLAEQRFGVRIRRAVMTMSAGAPAGYRDAIIRASKIAHLELVDLIAEPVAASLALDLHSYPGNRRIVVCDFGGSTFDVSAVVQQGLRFTPVGIGGDHLLGGDDLDDALANTIAGVVYKKTRYDMTRDVARWTELLLRCENVKRQLSVVQDTPLAMREAYTADGRRQDLRVQVDRPFAERAWATLMHRVKQVIEDLLQRTGWTPDQVDLVGLVGGGSMIPVFQATVASVLPADRIRRADQPELAVAQGATLLTARHGTAAPQLPALSA